MLHLEKIFKSYIPLTLVGSTLLLLGFSAQGMAQDKNNFSEYAFFLFHPSPYDLSPRLEYIPKTTIVKSPKSDIPDYLAQDSGNPLLKLWLEKEIKKHKNMHEVK